MSTTTYEQLNVRVQPGLRSELRAAARVARCSMEQAAREALSDWIERAYLRESLEAQRLVAAVREEEAVQVR